MVLDIYLLGVEQPSNFRLAASGGAQRVGLSFHSLRKRLPKRGTYLVSDRLPNMSVYLASGGHTLGESDTDIEDYVSAWSSFVEANVGYLSLVTEVDDPRCRGMRPRMREVLGDVFSPVWAPDFDQPGLLQELAAEYRTVSLRARDIWYSPPLLSRLSVFSARYGTRWHLLDGARPDDLMTGRFASAATMAWLAPMRNGETIVWDGVRMHRYPKKMQQQARRQHRARFGLAGFDADKIIEGDYAEITRYTVSAFVQMEAYMSKRRPPSSNPFHVVTDGEGDEMSTSGGSSVEESSPETPSADVDTSPVVVRNGVRAPTPRRGGPQVLPVFDFERVRESELGTSGELQEVERLLARKGTATLRACDSCHVAATCPAFSPGSECAYHLPIEIRTKAQLSAALASLLEKQVDRVAFMVMQEDLNGGYADPNTGTEIDRLMSMVKSIKDIEDNREFVRFQVEAKAQGGVLSALFGEQAKQLAALDRPLPATVIEDIIDADPD